MCWDKLAVVGQLVLVILEQIQRAQPSLSRALCLCSFSRRISQPVCLVLASEPTRNLLCVVTQHECVLPAPIGMLGTQKVWMVLCLSQHLPKRVSSAEIPGGGDSFS